MAVVRSAQVRLAVNTITFSVLDVAGVFATHSHFSYYETPPPPADDKEIRARSHHDNHTFTATIHHGRISD